MTQQRQVVGKTGGGDAAVPRIGRRRLLRLSGGLLLAAAVLGGVVGCGGGGGGGDGGGTFTPPANTTGGGGGGGGGTPGATSREYQGTCAVTYRVFNSFGQPAGDFVYQGGAAVEVLPTQDGNPFELRVNAQTLPPRDGQFVVRSNGVLSTSQGPLLVRFWDLGYDGVNVSGVLRDNGGSLGGALSANVLYAPLHQTITFGGNDWLLANAFPLWPENTVLSGTVTEQEVRLRIQADHTGGLSPRPFVADVVAARSR